MDLDTQPFFVTPNDSATLAAIPGGWDAARRFRELARDLSHHVLLRELTRRAVDAVLQRARSLLKHSQRPTSLRTLAWPARGDLDLHATLERPPPWTPERTMISRPDPRQADVVLVLDMSLSMTGEKIALLAVAAAIMQMKLEQVGVVTFDTTARTLVSVGRPLQLRTMVQRVLQVSAMGYTNICAGLRQAAEELRRSRRKERVAILFTDGIGNVGWDPNRQASLLPRLHVVHVGSSNDLHGGARNCQRMASAGRGHMFHAETYDDLPAVSRQAIRRLFRA